jgi:hypothetical protein
MDCPSLRRCKILNNSWTCTLGVYKFVLGISAWLNRKSSLSIIYPGRLDVWIKIQTDRGIFFTCIMSLGLVQHRTNRQLNLSTCIQFVQDVYVMYQCEQWLRIHPGRVHLRANRQFHLFCMYTIRPGCVYLSTNNQLNLSACNSSWTCTSYMHLIHDNHSSIVNLPTLTYPCLHFIQDDKQLNMYIGVHKFILRISA